MKLNLIFLMLSTLFLSIKSKAQTCVSKLNIETCGVSLEVGKKVKTQDCDNIKDSSYFEKYSKILFLDSLNYQLKLNSEKVNNVKIFGCQVADALIHFDKDSIIDRVSYVIAVNDGSLIDSLGAHFSNPPNSINTGSYNPRQLKNGAIVNSIYFWKYDSIHELSLLFFSEQQLPEELNHFKKDMAIIMVRRNKFQRF
ncbi:hypothetical protein HHL16_08705 [Pseudoflavitalea sp. G-6-1-2]|uniref:hypothetical protein n=1 Tax=Pseudoflavitalea sp. G-6-1-2 TaxID=2728841 RepID=UPI001469A716|nr:hypothetical protein [Pseudoflavitalea sp. G-6-1-2]NML20952.1 hypothetical protein [Pseudoflavitalea sp. G-6-1-2]